MNIILHTTKDYAITQFSENAIYDIDNIKIYASEYCTPTKLILEYGGDTIVSPYSYICSLTNTQEQYGDYKIFKIEDAPYFSARGYNVKIIFDTKDTLALHTVVYCENLTDTSTAQIQVQGRTLQVGTADIQLLRDDSRSQQLTFKMAKNYDNIAVLDSSKQVQIDYIPADGMSPEEIEQDCNFYSDLCSDIKEADDGESVLIYWTVPATATRAEGVLRLALAIVDAPGHESGKPYVWQTSPLSLQVLPNLAARGTIFYSENEDSSQISDLKTQIKALEDTLANINRISIDSSRGEIKVDDANDFTPTETYNVLDLVEEAANEDDIEIIIGD